MDRQPGEPNPWLTMAVVMLGMIMSIIDSSIVNVALPHMMGTLGVGVSEVSWVVTAYVLANVIVIPLAAWIASTFGRTRLYFGAVVLFTASSVACGLAPSLGPLVFARVLQGLAAGVMMPTGQAILFESFPPEKRGMSMAIFGLGIMVGPAIGPTLGGWITDNYGWPWIFYVNLPVGILAAVLVPMFVRDPPYLKRIPGADVFGMATLALGVGLLQYVLEKGENAGWLSADWIVWSLVVVVLLLGSFLVWEIGHPNPAVDLTVFRDPTFRAATAVNAAVGVGLMGGMFVLPLFLQQLLGLSATQSGFVLLPGAIATAVAMPVAGRLANTFDPRAVIAVGLSVFALGMYQMTLLDANAGPPHLLMPQILRGFGMGLTFVPLSTMAVSGIKREQMAQATGLFTLTRQLGGSMGITWLASRLQHAQATHVAYLVEHVNPYQAISRQQVAGMISGMRGIGLVGDDATTAALRMMYYRVAKGAAELAFHDLFGLIVVLFIGSIPLLLLIKAPAATAVPVEGAALAAE